jgi:hypothetical protein
MVYSEKNVRRGAGLSKLWPVGHIQSNVYVYLAHKHD